MTHERGKTNATGAPQVDKLEHYGLLPDALLLRMSELLRALSEREIVHACSYVCLQRCVRTLP